MASVNKSSSGYFYLQWSKNSIAGYEKFKIISKSIIMYSMLLCLPVEIIAAPKGVPQTKLQSNDTRTKRPAESC